MAHIPLRVPSPFPVPGVAWRAPNYWCISRKIYCDRQHICDSVNDTRGQPGESSQRHPGAGGGSGPTGLVSAPWLSHEGFDRNPTGPKPTSVRASAVRDDTPSNRKP